MTINIKTYTDLWLSYSSNEKKQLFDTDTELMMDKFGMSANTSKKIIIHHIISSFLSQKRFDLIEEMYFEVLECCIKLNQNDIIEYLLKNNIEMKGSPFDNYWLYMALDNFYYTFKKDIIKCIEACTKSFEEIELYLPYLKAAQDQYRGNKSLDEHGSLPFFVFCRDNLLYRLIDSNQFEEAERYEKLMLERNYFPDKNGQQRLDYTRTYRLSAQIKYLLNENDVSASIKKCHLLNEIGRASCRERVCIGV
jgi:hypothetical protein